ncbi:MAG: bifunctional phosphopantothenoylcysteine decarboxylase/phosphopantothenate--cysteine ligase CoaBC [Thermodesulfovibrio sp.]|nr:bifunctional phosphopantothenoylcysteine decarboxylase/phosphopantothenate--cysteine ligase CoaBC [Thermodesulfovibrio sp.]MCX7724723.1 bifunctional phosphopantothenoylcysteine decarboxylase/phosphopantothenate--cysteine ligase CoaBC [Thermodesulfovibrio sp.]MDW7971914.1 bifunctional phosphopantothenoylcysteine decarboxylase/phosphopantothenate--cysteine ligase CoaBC [Thermodesulfovibrio sp.]
MENSLKNKKIIIGITGSIAAYKIYELIKLLKDAEAEVLPVMTKNACYFVTPLSVEISCGNKVLIDMFEESLAHIELAKKADIFLVAPATANIINKYASGIADDLLTTTLLAFKGPVIMAPAMNWRMYQSPQLQRNIDYLKSIGVKFVGPEQGLLACGEEGPGRLASINKIFETVLSTLTEKDLEKENIIITAGPTRQYIDPIRFITNRSSGKMGYALAKIAKRRGAYVTLISGPTAIEPPEVDKFIRVETTSEMLNQVMENINEATVFLMAAAPVDFEPKDFSKTKIEKKSIKSIPLKLCPDILKEVSKLKNKPFTVGFAAETGLNTERAKIKLEEKSLDMIILNDIMQKDRGMEADTNEVLIIYKRFNKFIEEKIPLQPKEKIASIILSKVKEIKLGK